MATTIFKNIIPALLVVAMMTGCSSLKPVSYTSTKQTANPAGTTATSAKPVKFLDNISADGASSEGNTNATVVTNTHPATESATNSRNNAFSGRSSSIEKASALQLKYAVLLNMDVEQLEDDPLIEYVDEWYGTRYRMGGTTKKGIDCSAFVQAVYLSAFAVSLPRTAREQYRSARIISATELQEGDLIFFNTTGGVSHVGIYLQNNKFIHASVSNGVAVSDMFDPYYLRRFIGAGRIEKPEAKMKR